MVYSSTFIPTGMNKRSAKSSAAVKMMEALQDLKEGEHGNMVTVSCNLFKHL